MKAIYLTFPLFLLSACDNRPVKAVYQTDVVDRQVEELFTHKDCTVYRFVDAGHNHYYTDCRGSTESWRKYICGHTGRNGDQPVYCDESEMVETQK